MRRSLACLIVTTAICLVGALLGFAWMAYRGNKFDLRWFEKYQGEETNPRADECAVAIVDKPPDKTPLSRHVGPGEKFKPALDEDLDFFVFRDGSVIKFRGVGNIRLCKRVFAADEASRESELREILAVAREWFAQHPPCLPRGSIP